MNENLDISPIQIKNALLSDAKDILILQKLAFKSEAEFYNFFSMPALTQTLDGMKDDIRSNVVLKGLIDGQIVGSVRAYEKDDTCFIGMLIVHPDFQNKGIGSKLLQCIENKFKKAVRYELFTGYQSQKNIKLYEKFGYAGFKKEEYLIYLEKIK